MPYFNTELSVLLDKTLNGRQIVIYGAGRNVKKVIGFLLKYTQDIIICDNAFDTIGKINEYPVQSPDILKSNSAKYFIVVSICKEIPEIRDLFANYGYIESTDYFYPSVPTELSAIEVYDGFSDEYGNKVIGNLNGAKVVFRGRNSIIQVGENFNGISLTIDVKSGCKLTLGDNIRFSSRAYIELNDNSECSIGSDSWWYSNGCEVICWEKSKITIGKSCRFGETNKLIANPFTSLYIGDDALFSKFITVRTDDGHAIYDIRTKKRINVSSESRSVIIKDHVWIGEGCMILYNTVLETGCVVGAKSLVKGKFLNNCLIAGHMARIIRKDIAWKYTVAEDEFELIPDEYKQLTSET